MSTELKLGPARDFERERVADAIACDDAGACPASQEWGGDACGYIVHDKCHQPAVQRRATEKEATA